MARGGMLVALAALAALAGAADAHGVIKLTDANFDELTGKGKWLVKFYAPWCGHCTRLAPVLEEVARDHFKGRIKVGKVDATQETELKSRFGITGFPTLEYMEDGKVAAPFSGGRDALSIAAFGERMLAPLVRRLENGKVLLRWLNTNSPERDLNKDPVSFVLLSREELAKDAPAYATVAAVAAETRPANLYGAAWTEDAWKAICQGQEASVCKSRPEEPVLVGYEPNEALRVFEGDLSDAEAVKKWTQVNGVPVFVEIGVHNFGRLTRVPGKMVALALFDPQDKSATRPYLDKVRELARGRSTLGKEAMDKLVFAFLDGRKWIRFVEDYNVRLEDMPRLVVVDFHNDVFFENRTLESDLPALLQGATDGTMAAHNAGMMTTVRRLWRSFERNLPYSAVIAVVVLCFVGMFFYLLCVSEFDLDEEGAEGAATSAAAAAAAPAKGPADKKDD